jgi:hypothetical protein
MNLCCEWDDVTVRIPTDGATRGSSQQLTGKTIETTEKRLKIIAILSLFAIYI